MTREDVIIEARSWVGTPFHWQASVKGRGCDCKGLVQGIARELGLAEASNEFARMSSYGLNVDADLLRKGLAATFVPVCPPEPGDILLLKISGKPQHLAILMPENRMIHTYCRGPMKVVETPLGSIWKNAIDSAWSWRGLHDS